MTGSSQKSDGGQAIECAMRTLLIVDFAIVGEFSLELSVILNVSPA